MAVQDAEAPVPSEVTLKAGETRRANSSYLRYWLFAAVAGHFVYSDLLLLAKQ